MTEKWILTGAGLYDGAGTGAGTGKLLAAPQDAAAAPQIHSG